MLSNFVCSLRAEESPLRLKATYVIIYIKEAIPFRLHVCI